MIDGATLRLRSNAGSCRNPSIVSGFVFVAPALPSTSTKRVQNEQKRKQDSKDSFIWRASLGQQLQRLYMRALLQSENAGLNYIRKNLQKRRDEVALGKLQVYADAEQEVKQVMLYVCITFMGSEMRSAVSAQQACTCSRVVLGSLQHRS